jgi:glycosyltransferase involved in cell wall biosynthesis
MKKVVIIGPAYPLRGGLATFNQRLAREFMAEGFDCTIYSFSLQYPSFLFPGTTQYATDGPPEGLNIATRINSINPFNWFAVGKELKKLRPDIVVVRYWLPFMGPALGTILRRIRKNKFTRIIAITDNVIPHEKRPGDTAFTKYFLKSCDGFVTMSDKVMQDLRKFDDKKPAKQVLHPLYDNFGAAVPLVEARKRLGLDPSDRILLFFGFIRKYKGLDLLIDAMKIVKDEMSSKNEKIPKLMIAGEFYEDKKPYLEQIQRLGISDILIMRTDFIPDNEVANYLCAADTVVQPYRNATQSGVTPLAYHFEKPMIVTDVGSLPAMVPDNEVGLVCKPEPASIAQAIQRFYALGEEHFIPHLRTERKKYSWSVLVSTIKALAGMR